MRNRPRSPVLHCSIAVLAVAALVGCSGAGGPVGPDPAPAVAESTVEIRGRVVDQVTDVPLQGIRVTAAGVSTWTDGDGRFRVEAAWRDFEGHTGQGHAVPLAGRPDTGLMWFFSPANVELTLKVLDGCALNQRYWVFVASGSTVQYSITVTDTAHGIAWTTEHESGKVPALIPDTSALATCP